MLYKKELCKYIKNGEEWIETDFGFKFIHSENICETISYVTSNTIDHYLLIDDYRNDNFFNTHEEGIEIEYEIN